MMVYYVTTKHLCLYSSAKYINGRRSGSLEPSRAHCMLMCIATSEMMFLCECHALLIRHERFRENLLSLLSTCSS